MFLVFDEIERLFELPNKADFVRLWRFLRGVDQQFPGRLRLLISGTSPECAESALIAGLDNPLFRYLSVRYLGRLGPDDSKELITALGAPIGLRWDARAIEYVLQQTGGHPALLRSMGSTVHVLSSPRTEPRVIDRDAAVSAAKHLLATDPSVLAHVIAAVEDQYPDEFMMISMLTSGQVSNFRELAAAYPSELSHLTGYGLLPQGAQSDRVSIGLLQSYLQVRAPKPRLASMSVETLAIGEHVAQLRVISKIKSAASRTCS